MTHIREIKFRYVPKFSITKNIRFSNQKKIANNLVKYLKKLKYLKINNWVVKQTSSGKTRKSYLKERINEKFKENIKNLKWKSFWELDAGFAEILSYRLWENQHKTSTWRDKIIIWSC